MKEKLRDFMVDFEDSLIRLDKLRLSARTGCPQGLIEPIYGAGSDGYRLYNVLDGEVVQGPGSMHETVEKMDMADYSPTIRLVRDMYHNQLELFNDEERKAA